MGKFKLNAPYKMDPVPRYEVPFQPDNTEDDSGLVAKANKNGTMIVNKNIPIDDPVRKEAESHEDHHIKDMIDGKLDYDDNKVYETISTGKVKEHSRDDFSESDKNLAWEKEAYKAGEKLEQKDMRPKPNKLDGAPNMFERDTPLAFQKMGSRHESGRTQDENKISHTERFGPSLEKPNRAGRSKKSGVLNGKFDNFYATGPSLYKGPAAMADPPSGVQSNTDGSGNLEKEIGQIGGSDIWAGVEKASDRKNEYTGAKVNYQYDSGFYYDDPNSGSTKIKNLNDLGSGYNDSNPALDEDIDKEKYPNYSTLNSGSSARRETNRDFNNLMNKVNQEKDNFNTNNSYIRDNPRSTYENISVPGLKGGRTDLSLDPTWEYDNNLNQRDNINSMRYTSSNFDRDGKLTSRGKLAPLKKAAGADPQSLQQPSEVRNKIFGDASAWKKQQFLQTNTTLRDFQASHPNTFSYTSGNAGT